MSVAKITVTKTLETNELSNIWQRQAEQQRARGITVDGNISHYRDMTLAATDELHEALRELNWKPWSYKDHEHDWQSCREELVDVFVFFVNLCLVSGLSAEELVKMYHAKADINAERAKIVEEEA